MTPNSSRTQQRPATLDELRRCLEQERLRTGRQRIGERMSAVLTDMLARPGQAAVQSISELAAHNGVDPSTLTRLGQRLGFSGFAPLQDLFRQHVAQTQPFYSKRVRELIEAPQGRSGPTPQQQLAESEFQKVMATASGLSTQQVQRAAKRLLKAKRVHVLGLRGTYAVAHFFGTFLESMRDDVIVLGGPGFPLAAELARIKRGDVLVAMAFRPHTRAVVDAVRLVRSAGTPVLAFTDGGSPIDVEPDGGQTLRIDQPFYFDSALSQFFAAEVVLLAVARLLGPAATDAIRDREAINKALDIEIN